MKQFWQELKYAFYVIVHPFDGFWCIKREGKGSIRVANFIVFMLLITSVLSKQCTSFAFNLTDKDTLNIFKECLLVVLPIALWCVAGWSITTLMDGEGKPRDIYISCVYSTLPLILLNLPLVPITHMLSLDEGSLYTLVQGAAILWTGFLLFIATMTVHQYTISKTILMILLMILGMALIIFLVLLFFVLIQQLINFIYVMYKEFSLRFV